MDCVRDLGVVEERRRFAWNGLVPQRLATGDPEHVPAGAYAKEALE